MNNISKFGVYIVISCITGVSLFILNITDSLHFEAVDGSTVLLLILSVILLNHYMILLPPKGNALSLDSAIYLATLFVLGLDVTLAVLLWSSLIFALYEQRIIWWKHLFNFSIYSLMILGSYYSFIYSGGITGSIEVEQLAQYILALSVYFLVNVLLVGIYFILNGTESLFVVIKGMIKETTSSYLSTLVLAIILGILLTTHQNFGLILFTSVVMLLSVVFKQYFSLYEEVSKKANLDKLTGLYNHSYFKEVLEDFLVNKNPEKLCLAFIDIDDFKKYNDFYGHLAGDELLKYFSRKIKERSRRDNFFVARYGGEEFVIIMPGVNGCEAMKFLNKLRKEVNDKYYKGVEILPHGCLSFSGGVVEHEAGTYNSTELISMADQAMYRAKSEGKNAVHLFDAEDSRSILVKYEDEIAHLEQQLSFFLQKDVATYQHSKRVFHYASRFSEELELSEHEKKLLVLGALIHDIGKIEIPRDIINKKGKLEDYEWEMMKKHTTWGKEIISVYKSLQGLIPLVEFHHERYDGKGYPHGLSGTEIPKLARILCIIDSFDAMTTERPYQPTKTFSEAIEELEKCSGTQFDPEFTPPFIAMIKKYYSDKLANEEQGSTV